MINTEYLVKLIDGEILDVIYNQEYHPGCPTCDYGSEYINEWWVKMTDHVIHVEVNNQYNHCISASWIMRLFLQNLSEIKKMKQMELFDFIKSEVEEYIQAQNGRPNFSVLLDDDSHIPVMDNTCC